MRWQRSRRWRSERWCVSGIEDTPDYRALPPLFVPRRVPDRSGFARDHRRGAAQSDRRTGASGERSAGRRASTSSAGTPTPPRRELYGAIYRKIWSGEDVDLINLYHPLLRAEGDRGALTSARDDSGGTDGEDVPREVDPQSRSRVSADARRELRDLPLDPRAERLRDAGRARAPSSPTSGASSTPGAETAASLRCCARYAPAEAEMVGVDLTAADVARENLAGADRVTVLEGDMLGELSELGSFDFIYCQEVLHHTADPEARPAQFGRAAGARAASSPSTSTAARRRCGSSPTITSASAISELPYERGDGGVPRASRELGGRWPSSVRASRCPRSRCSASRRASTTCSGFVYHFFMKCFWNDELDAEANAAINFDWYHPQLVLAPHGRGVPRLVRARRARGHAGARGPLRHNDLGLTCDWRVRTRGEPTGPRRPEAAAWKWRSLRG